VNEIDNVLNEEILPTLEKFQGRYLCSMWNGQMAMEKWKNSRGFVFGKNLCRQRK